MSRAWSGGRAFTAGVAVALAVGGLVVSGVAYGGCNENIYLGTRRADVCGVMDTDAIRLGLVVIPVLILAAAAEYFGHRARPLLFIAGTFGVIDAGRIAFVAVTT